MILLDKYTSSGNTVLLGINVLNIIETNPKDDSSDSWIKYWDGKEVRHSVVKHSVDEIAYKVFVAKHGKKPPKGLYD